MLSTITINVTRTINNPCYEAGAAGIKGCRCLCKGQQLQMVVDDNKTADGIPARTTALYLKGCEPHRPILAKSLPVLSEWTDLHKDYFKNLPTTTPNT